MSWMLLLGPGCSAPKVPKQPIRGAWLAEYARKELTSPEAFGALRRMKELGVRWLAVGPEATMPDMHRPEITFGQHDASLIRYLRMARKLGFRILLLPRIESPSFFRPPYPFRADIAMKNELDWILFYENYQHMLLHYAKLAQKEKVDILAVGLEYRKSIQLHPGRWKEMIAAVRKVFRGRLTYSANWWKEYEEVEFWDSLDLIGIGAYFEVAKKASEEISRLLRHWLPIKKHLRKLSKKFGKPVLFSEMGYPSFADAGRYPWKWQGNNKRKLDTKHQADCYEAMFRSFFGEGWFAGLFIWRFYTSHLYMNAWEYTPEGKPAEEVIRHWFDSP